MIISFFDNEQNRKAINDLNSDKSVLVSYFPNSEFDLGNKLTLISLKADGNFQKLISPKKLMENFLKKGLPDFITEVEILVSDIDEEHPLLDYGIRLGKEFLAHNREISVKIPMSNNGRMLVVPPKNRGAHWQFFLINYSSIKKQGNDFNSYYSLSDKELIFEGKLGEFLQQPDCIIYPEDIKSGAKITDISINPFYQSY